MRPIRALPAVPRENALLGTSEAARLLGVSVNGVRWLEREGLLPCERMLGGQRAWRLETVLALVADRAKARARALARVEIRMARAALRRGQA